MYLTVNNQLTLLHDLLDEQAKLPTFSIQEYRKIKKLVQTMIANETIVDDELLLVLPEIYHYGIKGEVAHSLDEHVQSNSDNIEKWLKMINQTKQRIV